MHRNRNLFGINWKHGPSVLGLFFSAKEAKIVIVYPLKLTTETFELFLSHTLFQPADTLALSQDLCQMHLFFQVIFPE